MGTQQQIKLSVEEGLEYQKFDERMKGFQEGVALTLDFFRRQRVQQIIDSRKPAQGQQTAAEKGVNSQIYDAQPADAPAGATASE